MQHASENRSAGISADAFAFARDNRLVAGLVNLGRGTREDWVALPE